MSTSSARAPANQLPRALPSHVVFNRMNWSTNECIARGLTDGPCGPVDGF